MKKLLVEDEFVGQQVRFLFITFMTLSFSVCFFCYKESWKYSEDTLPYWAWLMWGVGMFAIFGVFLQRMRVYVFGEKQSSGNRETVPQPVFWISGFLFLLQLLVIHSYYFHTDWDSATVTWAAEAIANGLSTAEFSWYYSLCPNNLFLTFLFAIGFMIAKFLGISQEGLFLLIAFQCVLSCIASLLLFNVVQILTRSNMQAIFAWGLYCIIVGASPWLSIPYSDSVAIIFPILLLWLYLRNRKQKWFEIGLITLIGYKIKPQISIVTIAIVLIKLADCIFKKRRGNGKQINLIKMVHFLCGVFLAVVICNVVVNSVNIQRDPQQELGLTHYMMMGLNTESKGAWSGEDLELSRSVATTEERVRMNLTVTIERLKDMGLAGYLRHLKNKTLVNYCDGTFNWGGEGVFYYEIYPPTDERLSPIFRNIYYGTGTEYWVWKNWANAIWSATLAFSIFAAKKKGRNYSVIMLSIVGITIFELLFEARSRYFICFLPLYIILSTVGFWGMAERAIPNHAIKNKDVSV